jgi:polygalacturonase
VAIVQISRITNRKGVTENLPQLAGAELGWCTDSRRLFIGNGTLQEGAPVVGNTEILTEFSDITVLSNYTYQDTVVGYTAQTGPTPSSPTIRTVQAKLDDQASVRDFGAVGNGVTDDTAAINRALYQLYCRDTNTQVRRSLFFPAGTYLVTECIIIPTFARLVGEGANSSIILLNVGEDMPPECVIEFGDNRLQTGNSIGLNNGIAPQNIEISSMGFQTMHETDICVVDRATQCWFSSVNFTGAVTQAQIENVGSTPLPEVAAIRFSSGGSLITNDITFDLCGFYNSTYAIQTDQVIQDVTVTNSKFNTLYQGINLYDQGPTGFRAIHNMFDNIYSEGIVYDNVNLNVSAYNIFYNVGDGIGAGTPISPIITFGNDLNVSANDLFARIDSDAYLIPRVRVSSSTGSTGGTQFTQGRYTIENGKTFVIEDAVSNQTIFIINSNNTKAFQMQYTIIRDTAVRTGTFVVVPTAGTNTVTYSDDYNQSADTGVTLTATKSSTQVSIKYTSSNAGIAGTLLYSTSYLA